MCQSINGNAIRIEDPKPANLIAFLGPFEQILHEMPEIVGGGCLGDIPLWTCAPKGLWPMFRPHLEALALVAFESPSWWASRLIHMHELLRCASGSKRWRKPRSGHLAPIRCVLIRLASVVL